METTLYKLFIDINITGKLLTKNDLHDKNKHEVVLGANQLQTFTDLETQINTIATL